MHLLVQQYGSVKHSLSIMALKVLIPAIKPDYRRGSGTLVESRPSLSLLITQTKHGSRPFHREAVSGFFFRDSDFRHYLQENVSQ